MPRGVFAQRVKHLLEAVADLQKRLLKVEEVCHILPTIIKQGEKIMEEKETQPPEEEEPEEPAPDEEAIPAGTEAKVEEKKEPSFYGGHKM